MVSKAFPSPKKKLMKDDALLRDAFQRELSLTELLGGHVVFKEGEQVPTSDLEGMVVGLYIFDATSLGLERTRTLVELWNSLKDEQREEFEIVMVEICTCLFFVGIGRDNYSADTGYFIILEPGSPTLSLGYFAFDIYGRFGIDSYPFTPERAVTITKKREQEEALLVDLLSLSAPLRRGGNSTWHEEDITFWHLQQNNVIALLLFATHSCYESGLFLFALKQKYLEKKGTNDHFKIIYISMDCDRSCLPSPVASKKCRGWSTLMS